MSEKSHNIAKNSIHVAAAIVLCKGKVLACQRGYGNYRGWWEFPGGKLEAGEAPSEAVLRELREELDWEVEVLEQLAEVETEYPEYNVRMTFLICRPASGSEPVMKEHMDMRWLGADELHTVQWLPTDLQILDRVKEYIAP